MGGSQIMVDSVLGIKQETVIINHLDFSVVKSGTSVEFEMVVYENGGWDRVSLGTVLGEIDRVYSDFFTVSFKGNSFVFTADNLATGKVKIKMEEDELSGNSRGKSNNQIPSQY